MKYILRKIQFRIFYVLYNLFDFLTLVYRL